MTNAVAQEKPILVTGATGYIGGRLVPRLLEAGYRVRCLVRSPRKLDERPWARDARVEIRACDLESLEQVRDGAQGCSAAYYLVHSMIAAGKDYRSIDLRLASHFAHAAKEAGIERMVYLGGLGETGKGLSEHLSSRREVEEALASTGVPVTVLRAAMIIGSGSASFEILRYLVERLPIMVTPRWVKTRCQPIAVRDVLACLIASIEKPEALGQTLDIGGSEVLTYSEIMNVAAQALGLRKRIILPVPILTPRLSSLWIHVVTPLSAKIARPLAEGLRNEVVCRHDRARRILQDEEPLNVREAIEAALGKTRSSEIETRWSDAGVMPGDPEWAGGTVFEDPRSTEIDASPATVYRAVCRVGGGHGWYAADWLWRLRGAMDRVVGGPGLRRGRRDPEKVGFGEALDFWRVTDIEQNRRLELHAEMKLPGIATLTFEVEPHPTRAGNSILHQKARFLPRGLSGLMYWYAVLPLHGFVFRGMLRGIRRTSEREERQLAHGVSSPRREQLDPHRSLECPRRSGRLSARAGDR